ncbi:MAG: DUF1524 domain-containing protein [Bdellovibrionales bacterium]
MDFWTRGTLGSLFLGLNLWASVGWAQYYTFSANVRPASAWQEPQSLVSAAARSAVDLLSWSQLPGTRPRPPESYDRLKHFGSWIETSDQDCYDTRAEILIRDSEKEVRFSANNPCRVSAGYWSDPYSGRSFTQARDVQIDHVVALKNAYDSGAYAWTPQARCAFANFKGYELHLISVSGHENQAKGDRAPDQWMPSDVQYACQHLHNWLTVKLAWNLNMESSEAQAVRHYLQKFQCEAEEFRISRSEMAKIRRAAQQALEDCR